MVAVRHGHGYGGEKDQPTGLLLLTRCSDLVQNPVPFRLHKPLSLPQPLPKENKQGSGNLPALKAKFCDLEDA